MLSRRTFLKLSAAAGSIELLKPFHAFGARYQTSSGFFGLHPFVEAHPEAVFIMRTQVDVKTNSEAKKQAGIDFARTVMVPKKDKGIPLTYKIPIKPNLTCSETSNPKYTDEYRMGVNTDGYFIEGVIEGMKELGFSGKQFYIREVNCPNDWKAQGFIAMAERTGAELKDMSAPVGEIGSENLNWIDVPNGVIHRKIPYLWPINTPDSWLLNISKFKAHGMGITLCCKNHQGSIAHHYQQFCGLSGALKKLDKKYLGPDVYNAIEKNYQRHVAQGIPRWDRPDRSGGGLWMDIWATRTIDNLSASPMGLCVIEGIYGRDGNGFNNGPHSDGTVMDFMSNVIIFGKDPFRTDIIGHWIGGHEPGNFGLFHLAMERGLLNVLDPRIIPIYEWQNDSAILKPLENFERTPLVTYYLRKNYNNMDEPQYHLVNEPFDYTKVKQEKTPLPKSPGSRVLYQNIPNAAYPYVCIAYDMPRKQQVRIELLNGRKEVLKVLVDSTCEPGFHMVGWNIADVTSGTYFYRFRTGDFSETNPIKLGI
jgi:hypothetical protein